MIVTRLDEVQLLDRVDELADLLVDTVDGGASIGFLAPMDRAAAVAWWKERADAVAAGCLAVWAAHDGHRAVGTVSLAFPDKPNSRHRAELVKLMVHRDARGHGLGRRLLGTGDCLRLRVWGPTRFRCAGPDPVRYVLAVVLP